MFPGWLGPLVGTLMGLCTIGVIVFMLGVLAHVWDGSPSGFWVF